MGFFSSSKSHLEGIQRGCAKATELSATVRSACDRSLRGRYEYMPPEERADLVREARLEHAKLHALLEKAKQRMGQMETDQCPQQDVLAAESLLLSAQLDAGKADTALAEARDSLLQGMSEIEQFYGPRSKEARHLRKVLSQFQAPA